MDASRAVVMCQLVLTVGWLAGALAAPPRDASDPALAAVRKLAQALGFPEEVRFSHRRAPPPPPFMLDLYNSVADERGRWRAPTPFNANLVQSYWETEPISADFLQFDLAPPRTEDVEELLEAELHVYVAHVAHVSSVRRVRVSQVSGTGASRPLDTVLMPGGGGGGWAVFHLKTAAAGAAGRQPLALSLTEEGADGQWQQLNVSRRGHHHNRQPHLVLYSRDNRATHHQTVNEELVRHARSLSGVRRRQEVTKLSEIPPGCQRRELYIDFEPIGWSDFVMAPAGFHAYHCLGRCDFPMNQDQRPTNHAIVKSMARLVGLSDLVQWPSCVPGALSSVTMLFQPDEKMVVLKSYEDMVAEECRCQ